MSVRRVAILCEGPQDLEALRELLCRSYLMVPRRAISAGPSGGERKALLDSRTGDLSLELVVGGGRPGLHARWVKFARDMSPSEPYSRIGVSFDPNGDAEQDWRRLVFEEAWGDATIQKGPFGDYSAPVAALGTARPVDVVPLPWASESPLAYGLSDHQSLDRILAAAARQLHPEFDPCVEAYLQCAARNGRSPGWKEAAKSWEALLFPKGGFAAQAFGQDPSLWSAAQSLLTATTMWSGLQRLLAP